MVNQLRDEARKLEELNQDLQEKVNELKVDIEFGSRFFYILLVNYGPVIF